MGPLLLAGVCTPNEPRLSPVPAAARAGAPPAATFVIPVPPPTARDQLPEALVTADTLATLGQLVRRTTAAFHLAGVPNVAVYSVEPDGFAVVGQVEAIREDGTPLPGADRWPSNMQNYPRQEVTFGEYLRRLVVPTSGFYRVIVLVVTTVPVTSRGPDMTAEQADSLGRNGAVQLPPAQDSLVVRRLRPTALIYEFERPNAVDSMTLVTRAALSAESHLRLAGLWATLENSP
jgi:hypothetical protein